MIETIKTNVPEGKKAVYNEASHTVDVDAVPVPSNSWEEESSDYWDKYDILLDEFVELSRKELLLRLRCYREITQHDKEMSEKELIDEIIRETLNDTTNEDDCEYFIKI